MDVDVEKTREYCRSLSLCDCLTCRNFYAQAKNALPELKEYLGRFGVAIDRPDEIVCGDTGEKTEYLCVSYTVCGKIIEGDECELCVQSGGLELEVTISGSYIPNEQHDDYFVVSVYGIVLPWVLEESPAQMEKKKYIRLLPRIFALICLLVAAVLILANIGLKNDKVGSEISTVERTISEINALRVDYDLGTCKQLRGDVSVILFFIKDYESSWTDNEISDFTEKEVIPGLDFLEDQAKKYGVDLELNIRQTHSNVFYDGEVIEDINQNGNATINVLYKAAKELGYSSDARMISELESTYGTEVICITVFNKNGTSYALNPHRGSKTIIEEHCLIFAYDRDDVKHNYPKGAQSSVVAHEILHLFGAEELYKNAERKALAQKYYPKDIMLSASFFLPLNNIGDATAFYVGWTDDAPAVLDEEGWGLWDEMFADELKE